MLIVRACGVVRSGSLACELFDDVIEELETDLQRHVDQAAAAIKAAGAGSPEQGGSRKGARR